jgi:hypothetical protein
LTEIADPLVGFTAQETLTDVLNATSYSAAGRGTYEYLPTNHWMARIMYHVSGLTPLELLTSTDYGEVFAFLGLEQDVDYAWDTFGGVEGSAFGLLSRPRTLAKLAMLYLQNGSAAPNTAPLIDPAWVEASTTNQLPPGVLTDNVGTGSGYGYQWYADDDAQSFAMIGGGGQIAIVYPNENIVAVTMTSFDFSTLLQATLQSSTLQETIASNFNAINQEASCVVSSMAPSTLEPTSGGKRAFLGPRALLGILSGCSLFVLLAGW